MTAFRFSDDLPIIGIVLATGAAGAITAGLLFVSVRAAFEAFQDVLADCAEAVRRG